MIVALKDKKYFCKYKESYRNLLAASKNRSVSYKDKSITLKNSS